MQTQVAPSPSRPSFPLASRPAIVGTPQQDAFWREVVDGKTHILLIARAGTGKSFSICHAGTLSLQRRPNLRVGYCAYNKDPVEDLRKKIPAKAEVNTMHAYGLQAITAFQNRRPQVEENKTRIILKQLLSADELDARKRVPKPLGKAVSEIVSMCKCYLYNGSTEEIDVIAARHEIELAPNLAALAGMRARTSHEVAADAAFRQRVYDLVPRVLHRAKEMVTTVDMDDMIWLPLVLKMEVPQFDLFFVDECQDLNTARRSLAFRMLTKHGRLVCVGDPRQAIYGFTGADTRSMENIKRQMETTRRGVVEMPLTWTRRCPKEVVALAREIVPDIEAMPEAPQGTVEYLDGKDVAAKMIPGDMVLCRCNAPLVGLAHQLLRAGKKALLKGKDLSRPIKELIAALGAHDVKEMGELLKSYAMQEISRLHDANKSPTVIAAFEDKCATLEVLMEGCVTRLDVERKIEKIFEEQDPDGAVILTSAHSSKGLEADTIWLLKPDLMPHPSVLKKGRAEDIEQEMNLRYVAITRAKNRLVFITEGNVVQKAQTAIEARQESIPAIAADSLPNIPPDDDWRSLARRQLDALYRESPFDAPLEYLDYLQKAKEALPR